MRRRSSLRTLGFRRPLAATVALEAACSGMSSESSVGGSTSTTGSLATAASTSESSGPAAPGSVAAGSALVLRTAKGSAGIRLTDWAGRELYLNTEDNRSTSKHYGACTNARPPLIFTGPVTISGQYAVRSDLGVTSRTDGASRSRMEPPVYCHKNDAGPGTRRAKAWAGCGS